MKRKWPAFWQGYFDQSFPGKAPIDESVRLWTVVKEKATEFGSGIGSSSKKLGERRDALLLGAGALYLLGYLTWALYSLTNGIGVIAVLDVQYFAAGIVPAILIFVLLIMIRLLSAVQVWMKYAPTKKQFMVAKVLSVCGLIAGLAFFVIWLAGGEKWTFVAVVSMMTCFYFSQLVARNRGQRIMQQFTIGLVKGYSIFGLVLWLVYVDRLMPLVPTEWGGAKTRCILLDVEDEQLSSETRLHLTGKSESKSDVRIVRTRPLNLVFDGSEYFFFTEREGRPSETNPVYRLRRDVVKAVFPCPRWPTATPAGPP